MKKLKFGSKKYLFYLWLLSSIVLLSGLFYDAFLNKHKSIYNNGMFIDKEGIFVAFSDSIYPKGKFRAFEHVVLKIDTMVNGIRHKGTTEWTNHYNTPFDTCGWFWSKDSVRLVIREEGWYAPYDPSQKYWFPKNVN